MPRKHFNEYEIKLRTASRSQVENSIGEPVDVWKPQTATYTKKTGANINLELIKYVKQTDIS